VEEAIEAVAAVDVATTTIAVDVVEDQARTSKSGLVLLVYVAKELHRGAFADLGAAKQHAVREDAEKRFISYAFLRQSGVQHGNLKVDRIASRLYVYSISTARQLYPRRLQVKERRLFKRAVEEELQDRPK
jgi:hypothetical protein